MANTVSNHALIRYFQRVIGVEDIDIKRPTDAFRRIRRAGYDVEATRGQIADFIAPAIASDAHHIARDGIHFSLTDGVLATVLTGSPKGKVRSQKRAGQRIAYRESRHRHHDLVEERHR